MNTQPVKPKVQLIPVKPASILLGQIKRQLLLTRIKDSCGLEQAYHDMFYRPVISQFAEFVQALPFQVGGKLGGLLDYGLVRGSLSLQMLQEDTANPTEPLYRYAIFTAALLRDINRAISQQQVMISDSAGNFLSDWLPLEGSLLERADYYKIRFLDDRWRALGFVAAPLLVQLLMPEAGFAWIAQDYALLQKWLKIFTGGKATDGDPLACLLELIERQLEGELQKQQLPQLPLEMLLPEETMSGEEFLVWLTDGLDKGIIAVNQPDAFVHILTSGQVFLDKQIFNLFCQQYRHRTDWLTVLKQFNQLGLTQANDKSGKLAQFYANYSESAVNARMSYFLTGLPAGQKSATAAGKITGLPKVLEGVVVTRPELVVPKIDLSVLSSLNLQSVVSPPSAAEASATKLTQYLERMEERKAFKRW